jgi:hypothetical protein
MCALTTISGAPLRALKRSALLHSMTQSTIDSPLGGLMATGQPNKPTETRLKLSLNIVFPLLGGRSTWSHEHLLPIFVSLIVALMLMAVPFPGFHFCTPRLLVPGGDAAARLCRFIRGQSRSLHRRLFVSVGRHRACCKASSLDSAAAFGAGWD